MYTTHDSPQPAVTGAQCADAREARLEATIFAFALACISVGLVAGIGVMKVLGAR
jgi:hypothetical protein